MSLSRAGIVTVELPRQLFEFASSAQVIETARPERAAMADLEDWFRRSVPRGWTFIEGGRK